MRTLSNTELVEASARLKRETLKSEAVPEYIKHLHNAADDEQLFRFAALAFEHANLKRQHELLIASNTRHAERIAGIKIA